MDVDPELEDTLRPEYDLSQLAGGVRGKYWERYRDLSNQHRVRIATACGAVPLVVGTALYFTWRLTRWKWLEFAGLLNVLFGLSLFVVGVVCLISYVVRERRGGNSSPAGLKRRALLVGGLLLLNFPVAAIYGLSAIDLVLRYHVCVVNESDTTINSFVIEGPGVRVEAGPIRRGATTHHYLRFNGYGELGFVARQNGQQFAGRIAEVVKFSLGGRTVFVKHGGEYALDDKP